MNLTAPTQSLSAAPIRRPGRIDFTCRFMPEELTPLFHAPEYSGLPEAARRRYNQLHACYFNEQVAFFEQEMLSPALRALMRRTALPGGLNRALRTFFEEEQRHTAIFRTLNRRCAPEFYRRRTYHFIRLPRPCRALLRAVAGQPRMAPLLVWLALLQEERSLYYSKRHLEQESALEPHFVAVHRAHLSDEVGHIGWDEQLLDWLWPRLGRTSRAATARLLGWMVGEFFHLPKRSGRNVVWQLAREFPLLDGAALLRAMGRLDANSAFLQTLYSRKIAPRSFARFDAHPEFALLARALTAYPAPDSPA